MPPAIIDAATAFKDGLLQREAAQMAEAARRWLVVERTLQDSIDALAFELANTGTPTMGMLSRSARYQALRRQIAAELDKYAQYMDGRITDGQRNAVSLALDYSAASINAAAESQMVIPFNRLPVSATENLIGMAGDGSPLIDVLNDATRGAADRMGERLIAGLALGKNPIEVARQAVRLGLGSSFTRMQTIARTEMLRAAREATLQSYRASNVVTSYRRLSARDDRVCPACLFADGQVYDLGESFDQHPNCIVGGTVVSSPAILATSKRWFDGYVIEIRTVNGNVLTVTENHPILTDKGWIAAHLLQEGDNVISSLNGERTISLVDPNHYSRPTVIEDVLESFVRAGGMISVSVPSTPIYFHGDGMYGNVDIVRTSSFLGDGRQAALSEPRGEKQFVGAGMGQGTFFPDSAIAELLESTFLAAGRNVHGGGKAGNFFGRALAHHQTVGVGLPANGYTGLEQAVTNNGAGSFILGGNGVFGFAREVHLNQFISGQTDTLASHHRNTGHVQAAADSSAASIEFGRQFVFGQPAIVPVDKFIEGDINEIVGTGLPSFGGGNLALLNAAAHQSAAAQFGGKQLGGSSPTLSGDVAAIPGNVITDRIFEISRRHFSGHVYNLQTSTGWYIAGGIITHNCRCTMIPVLRNVPPAQYETGREWFTRQPESTQLAILGRGRYDLWRRGAATLDDMISRDWSDTWGGSLRTTRVRDLG